jgi:acetyl esterase
VALDPKIRALLELPGMQLGAPPPEVTPAMMREGSKQLIPPATPPAVHAVRDVAVNGPAGSLNVRLYYPRANAPLPLVVFYHGGGFVLCDLDSHDVMCRTLANESGCAVAAVDYRLAPETKFPGPLEDCYAALVQLIARAQEFGLDRERVAVAGDSAGANLATAVCMLARDRKGPAIRYQALLYPCLDAACDTPSMHECGSGYMLSRELMQWFYQAYMTAPQDAANPLLSPLRAVNLSNLPPASISTAEFDPLRDEGERYADRLRDAGVNVVGRRYAGMIHGFSQMPLATETANNSVADIGADLRSAFAASLPDRAAIARQFYAAALAGDWATVDSLITDDFTIIEAAALPFGGTYRGRQALQQLFAKVGSLLSMRGFDLRGIVSHGEMVISIIELTVDSQGREAKLEIMEQMEFRGAQICVLRPFYFDAAAVHAAALRSA